MADDILPDLVSTYKKCSKCNRVRLLNEFYKHRSHADGLASECKDCTRLANKKWRDANPDKCRIINKRKRLAKPELYREHHRRKRMADPERYREYSRQWEQRNPEKVKSNRKRFRVRHLDRLKVKEAQYREQNREEINARHRLGEITNRERRQATYQKYRAKVRANPDAMERNRKVKAKWMRDLYHKDPEKVNRWILNRRTRLAEAARCDLTSEQWEQIKAFYNHRCAFCGEKKRLTQDHVIPISKGGDHTASNIIPLCQSCNSSKGNRDVTKTFQPHLFMIMENCS